MHSDRNGAWESLGAQEGTEVMIVRVNHSAQIPPSDGELGTFNNGGSQSPGASLAHVLVDAERVWCHCKGLDVQLGWTRGTVCERDLRLCEAQHS